MGGRTPMSPAFNVLRLPNCKRCRLAVADRSHDVLQAFSDKTIVPQEIESCVLQKRIVVSRYAGITEKSHETYPCRCKGGLLCGKLCLAKRGRRRESAEIECEQLALLSNLATIRFLRTVLPCGLLPNQTLTR